MSAEDFKPRTVREQLAMEMGRSEGLREAFKLIAQGRAGLVSAAAKNGPENDAGLPLPPGVVKLEQLLADGGFTGSPDRDNPDTWVWMKGEGPRKTWKDWDEVAVDHVEDPEAGEDERVRWFAAGAGDPVHLSVAQAIEVASGRQPLPGVREDKS